MEIDANGTTLHAEQAGEGPPLVFVHGMCGDARVWDDQVRRLSDRYECTTYDRRGHTRSPRTRAAETVELHADDLAGLIRALDLAPCVVVGSSGGARITVDLMRRYPSLVAGAVVSEPPIAALAPDLFAAMVAELAPRVKAAAEAEGPRAAVDVFFEYLCPGLWDAIDEPTRDRYRDNAQMLFADLGMPQYAIDEAAAERIDVRTLVIGGRQSHPALFAGAQNLSKWLPNARLVTLDCGHVTYAEKPEAFAEAVDSFAKEG